MVNGEVTLGPWGTMNRRPWRSFTGSITQIFFTFGQFAGHPNDTLLGDFVVQGDVIFSYQGEPTVAGTITIDGTSEYLIGISGTYFLPGEVSNGYINSLTFITNRRIYGPYGKSETITPVPFQHIDTSGVRIVGFHGTGDELCESIGIYMTRSQSPSGIGTSIGNNTAPTSIRVQHWGGQGGKRWNTDPTIGIKRILIVYRPDAVVSIKFTFIDNTDSEIFGANGRVQPFGTKEAQIDIDYPREYITGIGGLAGILGSDIVIKAIRIDTTEDTYGPYEPYNDNTIAVPFSLTVDDGAMIAGFHGRAGTFLNAIGVFLSTKP